MRASFLELSMRNKIKLLSFFLGTALLLGLPPVLMLTPALSPEPPSEVAKAAKPASPMRALLAQQQSTLELFYRDWQKSYLAAGGDSNVVVSLGWTGGLSTEPSAARGRVSLDLINGVVRAEALGLHQPADLWLVDNQDGPGRTVQP